MSRLIRSIPKFIKGTVLLGSFFILFHFMLTPLFRDENDKHITGLEYADMVFNELSKGSSYFIPELESEIRGMEQGEVSLSVNIDHAVSLPVINDLLASAGVSDINAVGPKISFTGDLKKILSVALEDSEILYNNDGIALGRKYNGVEPLTLGKAWWNLLKPCIRELQKQKRFREAKMVDHVVTRAIEPAYNFYGITPAKMSNNVFLVSGLLIFYILYTLWYGFGIFEMFEGLGLVCNNTKK